MKEINRKLNKGLPPFESGIRVYLSEKQLNKLIIFCIQYKDNLLESARVHGELAEEYKEDEDKHNVFKDNSEYYKDMYQTIHELREYLDNFVTLT